MNIGVLAIQGDFDLHQKMLSKMRVDHLAVRKPEQLKECDGLIIPGGESTTFIKLLKEISLYTAISEFGNKKPIMGTCAGLITLSSKVENSNMETLNLINLTVQRNAYGTQLDSFVDEVDINLSGKKSKFEGVFIRAPKIVKTGEGIKSLGIYRDNIVMAEKTNILVVAFHPELTNDTRIHQYFIDKIS